MKSVCKETKQDIACPLLFGGSAGCWFGPTLPLGKRKEDFNSIAIVNLFPQSALELCKNLAMHEPVVQCGQQEAGHNTTFVFTDLMIVMLVELVKIWKPVEVTLEKVCVATDKDI